MKNVKNKPLIYGLTGGIASGKSFASDFFKNQGIKVFDSDLYVKTLWQENDELIKTVNNKYQIDVKTNEGKKTLANIIFNDAIEIAYLNSLVHPLVFQKIDEWILENNDEPYVIIDMPLLFEVGYEQYVDDTIVIYTTRRKQIRRLMKRDNLLKIDALKRINAQLDLKTKARMANYVIKNVGSKSKLLNDLEVLYGGLNDESRI